MVENRASLTETRPAQVALALNARQATEAARDTSLQGNPVSLVTCARHLLLTLAKDHHFARARLTKDMNHLIRTLIADKNDLSRQATRSLIESTDDMIAVGEARDRQSAVELAHELQPDVVLLGVDTLCPDDVRALASIGAQHPQIKTIVLSTRDDQKLLTLEAFRQGAWGYLIKGKSRPHEIIEAVRAVNQGKAILTPRMVGWILDAMAQRN